MTLRHLTDEELQDYMDGNLSAEQKITCSRHLQACDFCRDEIELYQSLSKQLGSESGFSLSHRFSKAVMAKIQPESLGSVHGQLWSVFLSLLGIVVGLNITFYFFDFSAVIKEIKSIPTPNYALVPESISTLKNTASGYNIDFSLLFFAGLTLGILGLVDYLIRWKHKPASPGNW